MFIFVIKFDHVVLFLNNLAYRVDSSTRKNFSTAWNHMAKVTHAEESRTTSASLKPFASTDKVHKGEKRSVHHGDEQVRREERVVDEKSERKRQRHYKWYVHFYVI